LRHEWHALWHRCGTTVFQSPHWLIPWAHAFAPEQIVVLTLRENRKLVGVAPFCFVAEPRCRTLRLLGCGISDRMDFLLLPEVRYTDALHSWLEFLNALNLCDTIELDGFPPQSARNFEQPFRHWAAQTCEGAVCPVLHLDSCEPVRSAVSARRWKNISYAQRKLEASGGRIESATPETLTWTLAELFRLHADRMGTAGLEVGARRGAQRARRERQPNAGREDLLQVSRLLHPGTNAPSTVGDAASHGCIRMREAAVEELARMIQEYAGPEKSASWYRAVQGSDDDRREIDLDSSVSIYIHS
jgi:hypothetical protein